MAMVSGAARILKRSARRVREWYLKAFRRRMQVKQTGIPGAQSSKNGVPEGSSKPEVSADSKPAESAESELGDSVVGAKRSAEEAGLDSNTGSTGETQSSQPEERIEPEWLTTIRRHMVLCPLKTQIDSERSESVDVMVDQLVRQYPHHAALKQMTVSGGETTEAAVELIQSCLTNLPENEGLCVIARTENRKGGLGDHCLRALRAEPRISTLVYVSADSEATVPELVTLSGPPNSHEDPGTRAFVPIIADVTLLPENCVDVVSGLPLLGLAVLMTRMEEPDITPLKKAEGRQHCWHCGSTKCTRDSCPIRRYEAELRGDANPGGQDE